MSKAYIKRDLAVGKYYADVEGGGGGGASYSETESLTGGSWIDGSPIYAKTIDLGAETNISSTSWVTSAFTIEGIKTVIDCKGVSSVGSFYYLNAYHTGDAVNLLAARDGAAATVQYVIIEYTKTA